MHSSSDEQIRISGKNLGELALPSFCPHCFWIKLKLQNRLPYQIFPGIFSSIDAYTKRVVHGWFDDFGSAPPWLSELGELSGYIDPPHHSKFYIVDQDYNIKITGSADGILTKPDGTKLIVDYKTAKYTNGQDSLLPIYETQLNAYARIAEETGISPISGLALIYMEPATDDIAATAERNRDRSGFSMQFVATVKHIDKDLSTIPRLLHRVRDIYAQATPPSGSDNCANCSKLGNLANLLSVQCAETTAACGGWS